MRKVNYKLLPKQHKRKLSVGAQSVRNSFYEPESHYEPYLTEYHGVYVENHFGIRFTDESHDVDNQMRQRPSLD